MYKGIINCSAFIVLFVMFICSGVCSAENTLYPVYLNGDQDYIKSSGRTGTACYIKIPSITEVQHDSNILAWHQKYIVWDINKKIIIDSGETDYRFDKNQGVVYVHTISAIYDKMGHDYCLKTRSERIKDPDFRIGYYFVTGFLYMDYQDCKLGI